MNKVVGVYCDKATILKIAYTIKEKIGCKIVGTVFNCGYSKIDILAEDGTKYLVLDMSTSAVSLRGLKVDEVWYKFSDSNKEKYFQLIRFYNCHLNEDKIKEY